MYKLEIKKAIKKPFSKIPLNDQKRIIKKIKSLVENPYPPDCKKLKKIENESQYSIIYEVHKAEVLILVVRINHRKDVYQ